MLQFIDGMIHVKKRIMLLVLGGMFFIILTTFLSDEYTNYSWIIGGENTLVFESINKVFLEIDEETLTAAGATFIIKNESSNQISIDKQYSIQILINEKWHHIDVNGDWTLESISILPDEDYLFAEEWTSVYGILPSGEYRLIKKYFTSTASSYIYCEFTIA